MKGADLDWSHATEARSLSVGTDGTDICILLTMRVGDADLVISHITANVEQVVATIDALKAAVAKVDPVPAVTN